MKKVFKVLLAISILLILLINLKIIPNPSDFTMTRDIILSIFSILALITIIFSLIILLFVILYKRKPPNSAMN